MKFLPDVAEEILIQNILTKYGIVLFPQPSARHQSTLPE